MAARRYVYSLLLAFWMSGSAFAQNTIRIPNPKNVGLTEEPVGLRILSACAQVDIDNRDKTVLIDDRVPIKVLVNGKTTPSSPSALYLKLASLKLEEIERIELQSIPGKAHRFELMLNFILKKRKII
jgi:hypothetical protein